MSRVSRESAKRIHQLPGIILHSEISQSIDFMLIEDAFQATNLASREVKVSLKKTSITILMR